MARKPLIVATGLALVFTVGAGCDSGSKSNPAAAPAASSAPASSDTASGTASPSTIAAPPTPPVPTKSEPPASPAAPAMLKRGAKGAEVTALQQKLNDLGYWAGDANGTFGDQTQQAVYALQKVAGVSRDGVVGPQTQSALDRGVRPTAKTTSGYVVEIDLKRQVLLLVQDGKINAIVNTSTGSMQHYERDGHTYLADTPPGKFTVTRQIDGWRDAPLGLLWRPKYFNGGIAVHGATSVPPYPASHGCARVSIAAMNWMWTTDKIPLKTAVLVYD
jgi:peptidoglycan hydrolase-like protein with peptidoglycan-binding domain